MRLISLIFAICVLSACHPKASAPEPTPAPSIEKPDYPKQGPVRSRDMIVRHCTVTRAVGNKTDCICRNATTHLDAKDPSKQMMVCK